MVIKKLSLSMITWNVNELSLYSKGIKWLDGLEPKTQIYAVYKKVILDLRTHELKMKRKENQYKKMTKKGAWVAILHQTN